MLLTSTPLAHAFVPEGSSSLNYWHYWQRNESFTAALLHDITSRHSGHLLIELPASTAKLDEYGPSPCAHRCADFLAALITSLKKTFCFITVVAAPESGFGTHKVMRNCLKAVAPHRCRSLPLGDVGAGKTRGWLWHSSCPSLAKEISLAKTFAVLNKLFAADSLNPCSSTMGGGIGGEGTEFI